MAVLAGRDDGELPEVLRHHRQGEDRQGADVLLEEVRYVELSDRPDFNDRFVDRLAFPV